MKLLELNLRDFRNIARETLKPGPGVNYLTGLNGQGKTSFIEALYLLSSASSFRTHRDDDMIADGASAAHADCHVQVSPGNNSRLSMDIVKASGKRASIQGVRVPRLADFAGLMPSVMVHPGDIDEVRGAPDLRRRFMDTGISMASRDYLVSLKEVRTAMDSKRAILTKVFRGSFGNLDRAALKAVNETAVEPICRIIRARSGFLSRLTAAIDGYWNRIVGTSDRLHGIGVAYKSFLGVSASKEKVEDLADSVRKKLAQCLAGEIERGKSLPGPQRDDFEVLLNDRPARRFASQGEARTLVVAFRLFLVEEIARMRGEQPLVLIDDILADLDRTRRQGLLECLQGRQAIVTLADRAILDTSAQRAGELFLVESGKLVFSGHSAS